MLTTNPFDDDKLREECGVFGIWGADNAASFVALGLHALQHRGQEGGGILSFDGKHFHAHRAMGHVAGNFDRDDIMRKLAGRTAIGHVRYATTGETALRNVQPLFGDLAKGGFAVAQNGNLSNGLKLRRTLNRRGSIFQSTTDTKVIIHLVATPAAASRGVPARVAWAVATVAVVALASGIFWVRGLRPVRPAHPAATAAPGPVAAAARDFARSIAPPPVVETAPVPAAYATANAGTTLVTITSAPAGAAVLDADDRLLGTTPFDLRVPADKPLQLTLKHDGYKPYTLKKQVEGEKVSLSVTMKTAKSDGYQTPNRRSVGYKDDPY